MDQLKIFVSFLQIIFRDTFLILALLLDGVGLLATYLEWVSTPVWILQALPVAGVLAAGFRIFKNRYACVAINFNPADHELNRLTFGEEEQIYIITMNGYIHHTGIQPISLHSIKAFDWKVNDISDEFLMKRLKITCKTSGIMLAKPRNRLFFDNLESDDAMAELPLIIHPNTIMPFRYYVVIRFGGSADEIIQWLHKLSFNLEYVLYDGRTELQKVLAFNIPFRDMFRNRYEIRSRQDAGPLF